MESPGGRVGWLSWGAGHSPAPEPWRPVASRGLGGALGGRARPERPGEAVFSLHGAGHQGIPQGLGLRGHCRDLACAVWRFVGVEARVDGRTPVSPQALDQTSQLVCGGRAGFWGAETCLHPPNEGSHGTLRVVQRAGGAAPGDGDTMRPGAPPPRQPLATRNLGLGTPSQPATDVCHPRPPVPVRADRTAEAQSRVCFAPLDRRPVTPGQARARRAGIAPGGVGCRVSAGLGREGLPRACVGTGRQRGCDLPSAQGALLVRAGREGDGVRQGTQGLGAPGALPRLGALGLTRLAGRGAPRGQEHGLACAREEGREEGPAGHPRALTNDLGELAGPLVPGLVPVLHRLGG